MAGVKLELEYDDADLRRALAELGRIFPEISARALGFVGKQGKELLYNNFLRGQEIDLKKYPFDSKRRRTVAYSIGRGAKAVKISAYPMNLFERGRMLRSGRKEPGKRVIKGKFKALMDGNLASILSRFDRQVLQGMADKL